MRLSIAAGIIALALAACGKKDGDDKADDKAEKHHKHDKDKGGDKDKSEDKGGGGGGGEWATVDCPKLMDHVAEIAIAEAIKQKPDQADNIKKTMTAQRDKVIAACEKEKGSKKMTPKQYDCVMNAKTMMEMGGCSSVK